MKDRLVTLVGALASLALVVVLLSPREPPPPRVSRPTSEDRGELGLAGLAQWLALNGVPTKSLRRRYSDLDLDPALAPAGNLLISSVPHGYAAHSLELAALLTWLDQGNRLLVLAAVDDRPDWAMLDGGQEGSPLLEALGFGFVPEVSIDGADDLAESLADGTTKEGLLAAIEGAREALEDLRRKPLTLHPAAADPLLAGVESVATRTTAVLVAASWQLEGVARRRLTRPLLLDPTAGKAALWAVRSGDAGVWISSYPDLFGNRTLGEADNARLLANLVGAALGPGGTVIFDDLHQGLSDLYDPEAFFADARLWNSLWFILAFWLLYVAGYSNRLAPPPKPESAMQASGLVEAMAGLFARRLSPAAVARGMLRHFFNEVRTRHRLPPTGKPCWDVLAADPGVPARDLRDLQQIAGALEAGARPDLMRLARLLHHIRETLR